LLLRWNLDVGVPISGNALPEIVRLIETLQQEGKL